MYLDVSKIGLNSRIKPILEILFKGLLKWPILVQISRYGVGFKAVVYPDFIADSDLPKY